MTANQIAFNKYLEDVRTHKTQEAETYRANVAREQENSRANTLNYQASIYSSDASMRNADVNAETQREVAAINSATSLGVARINQETQRSGQLMQYQTSIRQQDISAGLEAAKLQETKRHNEAMETLDTWNTGFRGADTVAGIVSKFGQFNSAAALLA